MRFQAQPTLPPFLNRRAQFRMLALVGMLMIIVLAIRTASRPSSWYWLTGSPESAVTQADTQDSVPEREIDYNVRMENADPLPPGMFRSVPPNLEHKNTKDTHEPPTPTKNEQKVAANEVSDEVFEIDPAILDPVKDNTLGVRHAEKDAHDAILAKIRDLPQDELERKVKSDTDFTVLMLESDSFRGELVTITGELKRLLRFTASKNEFGLDDLYEAWILTADSGDNLYRVVFTSLPDGLTEGEQFTKSIPVRVTGYFFKRYGYATVETRLHVAPMILAQTVRPIAARPITPIMRNDHMLVKYLLGIAGIVACVVGIMIWRYSVGDRKFQNTRLKQLTAAPENAIRSLANVEQTDVNDLFRAMSEEAVSADAGNTPQDEASS